MARSLTTAGNHIRQTDAGLQFDLAPKGKAAEMVSGNPAELRKVAQKAKQVASSLDSELKGLESLYSALRYDVPNKSKVDELLPSGRQKIREAVEQLSMLEQRLNRIAQGLENVNQGL